MILRHRHFALPIVLSLLLSGGPRLDGRENPVPVQVTRAEMGQVRETVELTGSVTAEQSSSLSSRTTGLVESVAVDAGSRVKRGDVLLELDRELAELSVARAEAEAKQARTQLAEAKRLAEEGQKLFKSGGIPRSDAKTLENNLQAQEAELRRLEIAAREQAALLERHRLVAPFDGVISRKIAEVGEWVQTGVAVLELVSHERVRFDVQAPQELYDALPENTEVEVTLDGRDPKTLPAAIVVKVPYKDPVSRTFLVRLEVEAPDSILVPGMSGTSRFFLKSKEPAVTVPRDAIVRQPDGSTAVWVVEPNDGNPVARMRRVDIGNRMRSTVEVLSGLESGLEVVVKGNESLQDGQPVEILEPIARKD